MHLRWHHTQVSTRGLHRVFRSADDQSFELHFTDVTRYRSSQHHSPNPSAQNISHRFR